MFPIYASTAVKECACLSTREGQAFSVEGGKKTLFRLVGHIRSLLHIILGFILFCFVYNPSKTQNRS